MMIIDSTLTPSAVLPAINRVFDLSAHKIAAIRKTWKPENGTPVFTVKGEYTSRGWTEWTQGFQYGSAILQFDADCDAAMLEYGRSETVKRMASHVSHIGVHDHGFNNVSTYGNLHRLMREGKIQENVWEKNFYELALKITGAVQAARWTDIAAGATDIVRNGTRTGGVEGPGYVYSFNGPHSLFSDTIRSMRALSLAHQLGHALMGERDRKINLLHRALRHAESTAEYNVYFGKGRDAYDVRGRVVHESIFNLNDGSYRCPSTQQGYTPFSTWTRGLAWVLLGFAEQLEYLATLPEKEFDGYTSKATVSGKEFDGYTSKATVPGSEFDGYASKSSVMARFLDVAEAVADFYIDNSTSDGIVYWDTGAPGLAKMGDYLNRPADPYNDFEPVDSSASVISAQGFLRLARYLETAARGSADSSVSESAKREKLAQSDRYFKAGLTVAKTLFAEPYLSTDTSHQGLLLHSVYHRPNGWDYIPPGKKVMCGESSMWGDYHTRELALMLLRIAGNGAYYKFYQ
jgi:unsaturated chondroitin disaccharide hydrolase